MSKKNRTQDYVPSSGSAAAVKQPKKKKKGSGVLGRIIRRFFLLLFTIVLLAFSALCLVMNLVFNGPSPAARELLTMALIEASATKWVPALFIGEEAVAEIRAADGTALTEEMSNTDEIVINMGSSISSSSDEWANFPDGIRIERYPGDTYNAHIMIVRDPSKVFMGISTDKYSTAIPGKRITEAMDENPDVIAAVNAGAFFDDGTSSPTVGSVPEGLVYSNGACKWTTGSPPNASGFAGFNQDNILVVSKKNMTQAEAEAQGIRDGCCFGPVLIMNGEVNQEAYNTNSGLNPRTAIGQRKDGAVIFVCIDGRQASSMGGTYGDIIDIMVEYGAYNACNMDGGSSSVMMYRDRNNLYNLYEEDEQIGDPKMINNYSLLQSQPRRMPNYWMVRG